MNKGAVHEIVKGERGRVIFLSAPIKTGKELGMKESYDEGLANHIGPESCGDNGNIISEALTGERAGWVLSPVRDLNPSADVLQECRRQYVINR